VDDYHRRAGEHRPYGDAWSRAPISGVELRPPRTLRYPPEPAGAGARSGELDSCCFSTFKGAAWKGGHLLFWGIGSDSSMGALSAMEKLSNREKDNGLLVIGIHDSSATVPEVTALAKRHGITFPVGIDADDPLYFGRTFRGYTIIRVLLCRSQPGRKV